MKSSRTDRMGRLFDYMVLTPQGATIEDIAEALECSYDLAVQTVRDLRLFLGEDNTANLTCNKQGKSERWLYKLVTDLEDHREWIAGRIGDTHSRLKTMNSMLTSAVNATDGRTLEGRRARVMSRQIGRLLEDLAEIESA